MQCGLFLLLWFNAQVVKNAIYKGIIGNFIRTSYTFSGRLFGSSHTFYGGLFGNRIMWNVNNLRYGGISLN